MTQSIQLQAVPNQTLAVPLTGQSCDLNVYQQTSGLYIDVFLNGEPIVLGVICQNANRIIRNRYLGFVGDFEFVDTQGGDSPIDPIYTGLGGRFVLVYLEAADLPEAES